MSVVDFTRPKSADGPTAADPLRGLEHLSKKAVFGRKKIIELADRPIRWMWEHIATAGLTILFAAGPGSGKTSLLALIIGARANIGEPVGVLGHEVTPAPLGKYLIFVENEHSDESAARILRKALRLQGVSEDALDRVILVARGSVKIGSPAWGDIEKLISLGLVSDVFLDTLGRCSPEGDSNSEEDQIAVFDRIAQSIELAPTASGRPTFWVAAHTRKCDGVPTLNDVSGSTQRAGQSDVVILMGANRTRERVTSVTVVFGKVREKDAEDWPPPVEYSIKKTGIVLLDSPAEDNRPLEEQILSRLALGPQTKTGLASALGRSRGDLEDPISNLFAGRRIASATVKSGKRSYPGFCLRKDGDS